MLPCRLSYVHTCLILDADTQRMTYQLRMRVPPLSLSPLVGWIVDISFYIYTHRYTLTRSSRTLSQSRGKDTRLSEGGGGGGGGRRTSWWRRQRGNVGPCARFSRNGHATMRGKVCNVSDRFCPRSSSIWTCCCATRRRKKKGPSLRPLGWTPSHPRGSNWFEDLEFIGILAGPMVVIPRKN